MNLPSRLSLCLLLSVLSLPCLQNTSHAADRQAEKTGTDHLEPWQEKGVEYARIMSQVKWTPVAEGMPRRKGTFEPGKEYTGVPYSSVKYVGRYIGFDIYLKTFLAAVENPHSVLYTENLYGKVANAECYYGNVCSSYTSYALQCGVWYVSRLHNPPYREGVSLVEPQSAQAAQVGDIIFTPPQPGSHVEIVTGITRNAEGNITHVRVEESRPLTTKTSNRSVSTFNSHLKARGRKLYRITDLDAWRGQNKAESFLFPNYEEDAKTPVINRVLLLDRGDWVPYYKDQKVKINIMDRDALGVKSLVVKRGDKVVKEIDQPGKGVIELAFSTCGDYTAHCIMHDGSQSQACEFSVCDLDFSISAETASKSEPWELKIHSDNMKVIMALLVNKADSYDYHNIYMTEQDRQKGTVNIPANLIQTAGTMQVWLVGENKYGRLKKRRDILIQD
ncbi:hypothetical protein [Gimesia sp.]|uniref:hypothetical protein n=1 Tax=Gimesia sp. TaxID=2024833 RepID=UPI000C4A6E27|nr:hypothetical protein [Gimesia sp.]MAX40620.1 hypothetical protein [Gimesia sp.]HAH48489.1 hypothetical protein [Planctomycetaceae bacterium]HBL41895.1 hypothetical protein [Planctomycetaceae bacterium]|tara:strand:+ start:1890 stop:3230 length:1341 start_codon:yes stop_codon:yes gene_type:complete